MVVAENPLWVVHSSDVVHPPPTGSAASELRDADGSSSSSHSKQENRARQSLQLLEGKGGTTKCAIYSVDIHPEGSKFATGGGDGTVRIWNSKMLFVRKPKSQYGARGAYESSGESSMEEWSNGGTTVADEASVSESSAPGGMDEEVVHDLSSLVRSKKGTTAPVAKPLKKNPTLEGPFAGSSPLSKQHHRHRQHRLLCTLSAHTGSSVLAVRFSTNGRYLASAGDDAAVCIYAPASKLSLSKENLDTSAESWTRIKLGRGHALDVVGLAWAPDDSHLVSCSLDSNAPIIVWKLTDLATSDHHPTQSNVIIKPYRILGKDIHTSTVKGVTFDPAGTYLASSGDDPCVCVWRAHDDWGLERKIDADSGIFRRWNETGSQGLSSQSLFRRISWSTDGAYICSTNAVVKNKHVASTISREGWAVSSATSTASGAANLVGHKQPVVVCRHCPYLLAMDDKGTEDEEPEHATLLALGDKRGFVTVWSTRKARPLFKLQCSETRCTVTDLAWGMAKENIMLLITLLDGQVVALKFETPQELGRLLNADDHAKVFQMRYGIDLTDTHKGRRRLFVGDNSGPRLIENALQLTFENEESDSLSGAENDRNGSLITDTEKKEQSSSTTLIQTESRTKGGKKRIQPILMNVDAPQNKVAKVSNDDYDGKNKTLLQKANSVETAMKLAEQAASTAEASGNQQRKVNDAQPQGLSKLQESDTNADTAHRPGAMFGPRDSPSMHMHMTQIPHSTDRIHSVSLPIIVDEISSSEVVVADCTNFIQSLNGSNGKSIPCTTLSISRSGEKMYVDQIPGTSCSAIAACNTALAIGTDDGCIQLYGTSPTVGWKSGSAFRSHPPLIFGYAIVALKLTDSNSSDGEALQTSMLVVTADGAFGVYNLGSNLKIMYKGTVLMPLSHMALSCKSTRLLVPTLTRIQLTDTKKLLLILSLKSSTSRLSHNNGSVDPMDVGVGGSLQAFVYDQHSELWMRVADGRFLLSDFYSSLPMLKSKTVSQGILSKLQDSVRLGAAASTLKHTRRAHATSGHADTVYQQSNGMQNNMTQSHCEDRMACAIALNSPSEFVFWLKMYARILSMSGSESSLRLLVDLLIGKKEEDKESNFERSTSFWWLSTAPRILSLNRINLLKKQVVPEMRKNRALQRLTNEIVLEADSFSS